MLTRIKSVVTSWVLAAGLAGTAQAASPILWELGSPTIQVGETFTVALYDDDFLSLSLSAVDFEVEVDQNVLLLSQVYAGPMLGGGASVEQRAGGVASAVHPGQQNPVFLLTRNVGGGAYSCPIGVASDCYEGDVAYLRFMGRTPGTTVLSLYPVFPQPDPVFAPGYYFFSPGGAGSANGISSSFVITVVPEPASVALMLAGLAAVASVVRRASPGRRDA